MDDACGITCVFSDKLPEIPYIHPSDYLGNIYNAEFTETKNSDGTYTISDTNGTMVIDPVKDTIHFDVLEDFTNEEIIVDSTILDSPYLLSSEVMPDGEEKPVDLDLGKYSIDIIENDGKVYLPLSTICDIFNNSYNSAEYSDGSIYFFHSPDANNSEYYYDRSSVFEKTERTPETAEYSYNELCFLMDYFYGRPSKATAASYLEKMDFDQALDEISDNTRKAKKLLKSDRTTDYLIGLCYLQSAFCDGGHTFFTSGSFSASLAYPMSGVGKEINSIMKSECEEGKYLIDLSMKELSDNDPTMTMNEARTKGFEKAELINEWEDGSESRYYQSDDTGVFVFKATPHKDRLAA